MGLKSLSQSFGGKKSEVKQPPRSRDVEEEAKEEENDKNGERKFNIASLWKGSVNAQWNRVFFRMNSMQTRTSSPPR